MSGDDALDVYVDDYLVGSDSVRVNAQTGESVRGFAFAPLPSLTFPAVFRGVIRDSDQEQPIAVVESFESLLKAIGPTRASAQIVGIQPDRLRCEAEVETLPAYPREFTLFVNNVRVGSRDVLRGQARKPRGGCQTQARFRAGRPPARRRLSRNRRAIDRYRHPGDDDHVAQPDGAGAGGNAEPAQGRQEGGRPGRAVRSRLEVLSSITNEKFFLVGSTSIIS